MCFIRHTNKKTILPWVIFFIGIILFVFVKLYNQRNNASDTIDSRLQSAAGSLELIVSDSMIEKAQKKIPVDFVEHDSIRILANHITEIMNVAYIYVMVKSHDSVFFVLSSYTNTDITGNIVTNYLDYYKDASQVMISTFSSSQKEVFDKTHDQWGYFRSIYLPRKTKSGIPYLLCADVRMTEVVDYQLHYLLEFVLSTVYLLLILLPLWLMLRHGK
jgi:hypothetical protein